MIPGIDIIEISRFAEACAKHPRLMERLFTNRELTMLEGKKVSTIAARFAGKEAILKALGTGLRGLSWQDIEILSNDLGEPLVYLSDRARKIAEVRGEGIVRISLSHSKENAIAMAILN